MELGPLSDIASEPGVTDSHADGEADVVLAGSIEHVELWTAAAWQAQEAERLADGELLFEGFGGLPTGPA